jgi:hypothetical protein
MVCYYRLSNFDYEPARNRFEVTTGNFTILNDSPGIFELSYYDINSQINRPNDTTIVKSSIKEIDTVSILLYILIYITIHTLLPAVLTLP